MDALCTNSPALSEHMKKKIGIFILLLGNINYEGVRFVLA